MGVHITKTDDIGTNGLTCLLYGESGIGKTTMLGTLPGRTLIIDIEGGTSVLRRQSIDTIQVPADLANLREVFAYIGRDELAYDNVCLDSATELEKFMLLRLAAQGEQAISDKDVRASRGENVDPAYNAMKQQGMPSLRDYGIAQFKMREYLREIRDLRSRGINVVVTALEMLVRVEQTEETATSKLLPMMSAKLAPEVCGLFDIVGHMEVSHKAGKEGTRFVRLQPDGKCAAKDRVFGRAYCNATGADLLNIPDGIPNFDPSPSSAELRGAVE